MKVRAWEDIPAAERADVFACLYSASTLADERQRLVIAAAMAHLVSTPAPPKLKRRPNGSVRRP